MIINIIINKTADCEDQKIYELEFIGMAENNGMKTGALKSAQQQMAIAKEIYTPKKIIRQLKEGDFYKELFAEMIQAYKDEDLQKLSCLVSDRRYMSEEAEKAMVINRNHNWVNKIPAMIKDKSVFFAIGAGHLPGKNGILQLLEKGDYIVNPLVN